MDGTVMSVYPGDQLANRASGLMALSTEMTQVVPTGLVINDVSAMPHVTMPIDKIRLESMLLQNDVSVLGEVVQVMMEKGIHYNNPWLNQFSGILLLNGSDVSFDQWVFELGILRRTCADEIIKETIQKSVKGAVADGIQF